jgi:thiol-disulfide isomerase/thioredoxin
VAVAGKIEVIEFFWYECPHCNAFEPALDAWAKRAPDDVAFRRVPVWFREEPFAPQQRLFFTLETLGLLPTLHRKVFSTIHGERTRLRTPKTSPPFALANGVDPVKFMATVRLVRGPVEVAAGAPNRCRVQGRLPSRQWASTGATTPTAISPTPGWRRARTSACWWLSMRSSPKCDKAPRLSGFAASRSSPRRRGREEFTSQGVPMA